MLTFVFNMLVKQHSHPTDELSLTLGALADPTRRAILNRLSQGEASVTELAEPFAMSLPAISRHLKVLERAGLITRARRAQLRPCKLDPAPLKTLSEYLEFYRSHWETSFDRLGEFLQHVQGDHTAPGASSTLTQERTES